MSLKSWANYKFSLNNNTGRLKAKNVREYIMQILLEAEVAILIIHTRNKSTILNVCIPKIRAAKQVKQKLIKLKRQVDMSIIIVRYFNTPLLKINAKYGKSAKK